MKTERCMQQRDLRNATPKEKREVILEILDENPSVSDKCIEELTGIPKSTVWTIRQTLEHEFAVQNTSMFGDVTMFGNEKEVEEFIRQHSSPLPMSNRCVIYSANNPFRIPRPCIPDKFSKISQKGRRGKG